MSKAFQRERTSTYSFHSLLINPSESRFYGGDDFQEDTVQAAAKKLRLVTEPPNSSQTELETLFQSHHDRVFRSAYRITGSAADAEDVLQTVFLRLVRGILIYDLSDNAVYYLSLPDAILLGRRSRR